MRMLFGACLFLAGVICVGWTGSVRAAGPDWPQWRGPAFDGSSTAHGLPDRLDMNANLAWQAHLPGVGAATPVIAGDRVFVSCWDEQSKKMLAVCLSLKDGHELWEQQVGLSTLENDRNNPASPSPATDGHTVFFYYATGDLSAFDINGKQLWARNIQKDYGPFNIQWIYGSSPLLYKGKLYVQVIHRDVSPRGGWGGRGGGAAAGQKHADSYLLAIDRATGHDLWRQIRPSDAVAETRESYASPIPMEHDGRSEIILVGGDAISASDAETGQELWRAGGWDPDKIQHWRLVPSAVVDEKDGLVFGCAPKNGPIMAVKDGGHGDVTATGFAWQSNGRQLTSDVCVPLFYKGNLYVLDGDRKKLTCVEPTTGKEKWSGSLGGRSVFRASPTGADDKIYCMNESGDVFVLAADEFKVLSKTSFGGTQNRACLPVTDGMVMVRIGDRLLAFKK